MCYSPAYVLIETSLRTELPVCFSDEKVRDLLCDRVGSNGLAPDLLIHESKAKGIYVNSKEVIVGSAAEVLEVMAQGEKRRHYGKTEMNDLSSRSHTILRLMIESNPAQDTLAAHAAAQEEAEAASSGHLMSPARARKVPKAKVKSSILNFCDLAGSERLAQTHSQVGSSQQKEGSFINKSLLFLGMIISKLSEEGEGIGGGTLSHLPFRESKLVSQAA
jgi:centromeric protein E